MEEDEQKNSKEKEKLVDDFIYTKVMMIKLELDMKGIVFVHQLFSFLGTIFSFYQCEMVYMSYIS